MIGTRRSDANPAAGAGPRKGHIMIRYLGIAFGIMFAVYYWVKRYLRKFERMARDARDEDLESGRAEKDDGER